MPKRKWKIAGHGGRCGCGGTFDVTKYRHEDTGETRRVCADCEAAAAAARGVSHG
jgi:hypothetical protein